eukprot:CAMPEP_0204115346 /NCGR_PEP_ID=MMETSP0361-20130328/4779_1 /ASSEMBLY_ACC=CAM_ASM_000343 /TAXON_ID=268821 /ORGANISM="Scrippsiella Hangoei, Strain SHTV-5" /LENGTH=316 /DNA_ID=CAMNT_0051066001 /DNA_START=413 /DNA_END=1363 /DNA_ORIENTATION=-
MEFPCEPSLPAGGGRSQPWCSQQVAVVPAQFAFFAPALTSRSWFAQVATTFCLAGCAHTAARPARRRCPVGSRKLQLVRLWSGSDRAEPERFGSRDYWENYYSKEVDNAESSTDAEGGGVTEFEWFCGYDMMQPFVQEFVEPALAEARTAGRLPRLLVAGCGNSRLGCELYDDLAAPVIGPPKVDIWNVDYAAAAVEASAVLGNGRQMRHVVGDLTALEPDVFEAGSFDAVVDKGTLDALFCAGVRVPLAAAAELRRVLRVGGRVFVVAGVATADEVLAVFRGWDVVLDGSPYINDDGDATINLHAQLYIFSNPAG